MTIAAPVTVTPKGTPYLTAPGVSLLAATTVRRDRLSPFLAGFDPALGFPAYVDDDDITDGSAARTAATTDYDENTFNDPAEICKIAGQLCYLSFGAHRTLNREAQKYIDHIKDSGHGSVLEHLNITMLFWGIDRSVTHELVRHRPGMAYSQVSQRYVDGKTLRFVERPEFQTDPELHEAFLARIDEAAKRYNLVAERLTLSQRELLASIPARDRRKAVNQAARALLPNEAEAPIIVTANGRAWRHFLEQRASRWADIPIRRLAMNAYKLLVVESPLVFSDYEQCECPDGYPGLTTKWRKV